MIDLKRAVLCAGASMTAITLSTMAYAQEFTFSIQHFLSPKAPAQTMLIEPWAKAVEEASSGRISFEIFPAMSLGGAPPELYSQVRDALAADFEDIHLMLAHVHTSNALRLSDVAGLKFRSPSRTGAWKLETVVAQPVGMPVPALPQAVSKGTVDAGPVPFEVALPFGPAELTKASVELADSPRFGAATFLFAMNKDNYNFFPEDLQQVADEQSGIAIAAAMGEACNNIEPLGIKRAKGAGNSVTQLSAEATAEFTAPFEATVLRWVAEAGGSGIDAEAPLEQARGAITVNSQ